MLLSTQAPCTSKLAQRSVGFACLGRGLTPPRCQCFVLRAVRVPMPRPTIWVCSLSLNPVAFRHLPGDLAWTKLVPVCPEPANAYVLDFSSSPGLLPHSWQQRPPTHPINVLCECCFLPPSSRGVGGHILHMHTNVCWGVLSGTGNGSTFPSTLGQSVFLHL